MSKAPSSAELLRRATVMVTVTRGVVTELQAAAERKGSLLEEMRTHVEPLRRGEGLLRNSPTAVIQPLTPSTLFHFLSALELERLKVELQSRDEEEEREEEKENVHKENRQDEEQRKLTVVEELKEELQQFQRRRRVERKQRDENETPQSQAFAAVQREIERQEAGSDTARQVSLTPSSH